MHKKSGDFAVRQWFSGGFYELFVHSCEAPSAETAADRELRIEQREERE